MINEEKDKAIFRIQKEGKKMFLRVEYFKYINISVYDSNNITADYAQICEQKQLRIIVNLLNLKSYKVILKYFSHFVNYTRVNLGQKLKIL